MKFSWENFDPSFLKEVFRASPYAAEYEVRLQDAGDDMAILCAMMIRICPYPDRKFIMDYRRIIEQSLLKAFPEEVRQICRAANIRGRSENEQQLNMAKKPLSETMINAYIAAIYRISGQEVELNEYSKFLNTVPVDMKNTVAEDVPLYDYQKDAVTHLKKHFLTDDQDAGLLVMPTGSGKSRTASYFLIREMVSRGYQILWLVHRHMLIDQAADCFYRFAGLSKIENPKIKDYRITCVSGKHLSIKQADKHEVIIASVGSVCRKSNKAYLRRILKRKVMIVVDEAQHTFAPTYRDTIKFIRKCRRDVKLFGLTATPVRANEKDSRALLRLFDDNIVYSVPMADLIAKGILSAPVSERVETREEIEPQISEEEARYIQRIGEMPKSLVTKLAASRMRNEVIIDRYMKDRERYGRTLIFALNIVHCRTLYEELKGRGVKCDVIYSGKDDNDEVISRFREGKLDVLINVNIMTEGTDVPGIQTVFLTRPTQSEGLLMQMIGRGMRGVRSGGTEQVYIVDFHDQWNVFQGWLNPKWLIDGEIMLEEVPEKERKAVQYEIIDWQKCMEVYHLFKTKMVPYDTSVALPAGWYSLVGDDSEVYRMLVFADQLPGLKAMMADKDEWENNDSIHAAQMLQKYFSYFCLKPAEDDLQLLMDNVRELEDSPQIHVLENRKKIDPAQVAKRAREEGRNPIDLAAEVYQEQPMAQDIFGTQEAYAMEVCRADIYGAGTPVIGEKVEELPLELAPFDMTPFYDLDELVQEVKDMMFGGEYEGISSVRWTDRPYSTYYGMYRYADNSILVNCLLNSRDVPRDVVKYIIYHEMLHRDYHYHDAQFRELEHKYPQFEEWDHFLDANMLKFDISE